MIDIWMLGHVAVLFLVFLVHVSVSLMTEKAKNKIEDSREIKKNPKIKEDSKNWLLLKSALLLVNIMIKD